MPLLLQDETAFHAVVSPTPISIFQHWLMHLKSGRAQLAIVQPLKKRFESYFKFKQAYGVDIQLLDVITDSIYVFITQ